MKQKINALLLLVFGLGCFHTAWAQNNKKNKDDDETFTQEFSVGGGLHTRGFTVAAMYGWAYKPYRTLQFFADFAEIKSPKERKRNFETLSRTGANGSSYIYGKRNNLYNLRLGVGQKHYISEKKNDQSITIALSYSGGISLGLLKPYYLQLIYRDNVEQITRTEPYTEQNRYLFLDPSYIQGAGGSSYGWDDLSVLAGGFVKTSVWIDFGADASLLASLELGTSIDFYFKDAPIMIIEGNAPVFFNVFANIYLGKRW